MIWLGIALDRHASSIGVSGVGDGLGRVGSVRLGAGVGSCAVAGVAGVTGVANVVGGHRCREGTGSGGVAGRLWEQMLVRDI
jgi:hypothetical protein